MRYVLLLMLAASILGNANAVDAGYNYHVNMALDIQPYNAKRVCGAYSSCSDIGNIAPGGYARRDLIVVIYNYEDIDEVEYTIDWSGVLDFTYFYGFDNQGCENATVATPLGDHGVRVRHILDACETGPGPLVLGWASILSGPGIIQFTGEGIGGYGDFFVTDCEWGLDFTIYNEHLAVITDQPLDPEVIGCCLDPCQSRPWDDWEYWDPECYPTCFDFMSEWTPEQTGVAEPRTLPSAWGTIKSLYR